MVAGLDQYGAGPLEQQQFGNGGVEGVKDQCLAYVSDNCSSFPFRYFTVKRHLQTYHARSVRWASYIGFDQLQQNEQNVNTG